MTFNTGVRSGEGLTLSNEGVMEKSTTAMRKATEGDDLLGYIYPHLPMELFLAHGLTPTLLRAAPGVTSGFESSLQTFACSYVRNLFSLRSDEMLEHLMGVVFPSNTCDSLQNLADVWSFRFPEDRVLRLTYPASRGGHPEAAIEYFAEELRHLSKTIETVFSRPFVAEQFDRAVELIIAFRQASQTLYASRVISPSVISYNEMTGLIREFLTIPSPSTVRPVQDAANKVRMAEGVSEQTEHLEAVKQALTSGNLSGIDKHIPLDDDGPRLLIAGGMIEPQSISALFDGASGVTDSTIILDLLSFGFKSVFAKPVAPQDDIFVGFAESILSAPGEPTQEGVRERIEFLCTLIDKLSIDGVIICEQSFCDPDQFEAPSIEKAVSAMGVRSVRLPIDPELSDRARLEGRIQSFVESLED
ncbi:MAG: 2-hydroxyacyl-CoA dehydratase [Candidatus Thorarchaeota archaeon]|nr:MAG: hypothetical protein DRP09_05990 [Candidatus Thorarchaeota archaeon]RLI59324.1 MAG: hypothetical protein DRO87_03265 [Candidatus Thorarchaeota archaeon]